MSAVHVEIASLLNLPEGRSPAVHSGDAAAVLENVYAECSEKGKNIEEWGETIRDSAIMSGDHPFLKLCERIRLPDDHPLRTLGAWAYGFGNPWIVIHSITVDGRTIDRANFDPTPLR